MVWAKAVWGARIGLLALLSGASSSPAAAQDAPSATAVNVAQPDFTLAALPTTLRMPSHKWAFRVTHRFTRSLGSGDFGDLLSDFFGFDSAATVGLEVRFGPWAGTQIGIHRTSDRTIQLFGQANVVRQSDERPFGIDGVIAVEGFENLSERYAATFGALLSRELGRRGAVYVEPLWIANSNEFDAGGSADNNTLLIGLGTRLRLATSPWYIVGEWAPRVAGYDPGVDHASFAVERRVGGHSFQINLSNAFGTTYGQIARGGFSNDNWYIGFNISRKFF
jgi:hypothetical protein